MNIKFSKRKDQLTFYLYGELDAPCVSNARQCLDKVIEDNSSVSKVIFDLSALDFLDSTGIGMIIGRYKKLQDMSINSYISGANVNIEKIIHLSGLYKIMPKY